VMLTLSGSRGVLAKIPQSNAHPNGWAFPCKKRKECGAFLHVLSDVPLSAHALGGSIYGNAQPIAHPH